MIEENTKPTEANTAQPDALLEKLSRIETLLAEQNTLAQKRAKGRNTLVALMLCLVLVVAVGMWWLNQTVHTAVREVPGLVQSTTETTRQMTEALENVNRMDFDALDVTIREMGDGLAKVDFEALNESILDLQEVVRALANLTSIFR